ncbi:MAG: FAD-dependent oxidoreductase [bacterium]|nr:FAD-dependent oxidoreductase [bacterium]
MREKYDIIVVGGGAAGLAAALFAARQKRTTIVIAPDIGGQIATTDKVENYLGLTHETGPGLVARFYEHLKQRDTEFLFEPVIALQKEDDGFLVETPSGFLHGRAVILAFGRTPRRLEVPGERELTGKGVSYSAVLDGDQFKGKPVAVVGGGNAAVEAAAFLNARCPKVYLIHRSAEFRADTEALERLAACKRVTLVLGRTVRSIEGATQVEHVVVAPTDELVPEEMLKVSALFIQAGSATNTTWLQEDMVDKTTRGEIVTDRNCCTKTPGVFAAGDITDIDYKQIQISAGEGVKAALQAAKYLAGLEGRRMPLLDWS